MQNNKNELRRPFDLRFAFWSAATFLGVGGAITAVAPMQPDLQALVVLVSSNRWNFPLCYLLWTAGHVMVEVVLRRLELQRESRRSNPQQPRVAAKRAEVKRRRRQRHRQRGH